MLARRAAGDDLAAFAALVRAHEAGLRRYLARLAGDEGDDLSQETLLAAWRAIGQWRGEGRFAGWLRRIATRRFLDRQRRGGSAAPRQWDPLDAAEAAAAPGSPGYRRANGRRRFWCSPRAIATPRRRKRSASRSAR